MSVRMTAIELAGTIYDAALQPGHWSKALKLVAEALRATSAALFFSDSKSNSIGLVVGGRLSRSFVKAYRDQYWKRDVWNERLRTLPAGRVLLSQELVSTGTLVRTEIYANLLKPHNIFHAACATVRRTRAESVVLRVHRPKEAKPFDKRDLDFISVLFPHIRRALEISHRFSDLEMQCQAENDTLNRLQIGVILVDGRGCVVALNNSAEDIIRLADGLLLDRKRLCATEAKESAELRNLIREAAGGSHHDALNGGVAMTISRPSLARPFSVLVSPLRVDGNGYPPSSGRGPSIAVFVSDAERPQELRVDVVARLFGLTSAEARLVLALVGGRRLEEVADEFQVSLNTVRTHLKHVFLKTSINRQSDLVKLVLSSPAWIKSQPVGRSRPLL